MRSLPSKVVVCALADRRSRVFRRCASTARARWRAAYFAIKNATVVPVSGPRMENATVIVARGVITAVGERRAVPEEAWVIDGTGLTVYPGLIDSFTDVGLPPAPAPARGERRR